MSTHAQAEKPVPGTDPPDTQGTPPQMIMLSRRRRIVTRCLRGATALWLPVAVVGLWFITSRGSSSLYYPPLTDSLDALVSDFLSSRVTDTMLPSLRALVLGIALALVVGLVVGYACGLSRITAGICGPVMDMFRATPVIALVPLFIAVLGIGSVSEVLLIAWAAVWPILLSTMDGVRSVDQGYRDTARALRMSVRRETMLVRLPAAAPRIMAGVDTAMSVAITAMVAIELYSSTQGVGRYLADAQTRFEIAGLYAGAIAAGIVGYAVAFAVRRFERRVALKWHYNMRNRGS